MEVIYQNLGKAWETMSGGPPYSVCRSLHLPLQYLASKLDFDYYWNWEMDFRYTGYYFERTGVGAWN